MPGTFLKRVRSAPRCGGDHSKSVQRTFVSGATLGRVGGSVGGMTELAAWLTVNIEVPGYQNYPEWCSCGGRHIPSCGEVGGIRQPVESQPYDHQWGL